MGNRNLSTKFYSNQSSQLDRQKLVETRQKHVQKEWHLAPSRQINRVWLFQRVVLVRSVGVHVNLVLNYVQEHCSEIQSSRSFIFFFFDRARARVKGVRSVSFALVHCTSLVGDPISQKEIIKSRALACTHTCSSDTRTHPFV